MISQGIRYRHDVDVDLVDNYPDFYTCFLDFQIYIFSGDQCKAL